MAMTTWCLFRHLGGGEDGVTGDGLNSIFVQ